MQTVNQTQLPWAIIDSTEGEVIARFKSRNFARVALNAISKYAPALMDLLSIKQMDDED
jgi:hypothetical protein